MLDLILITWASALVEFGRRLLEQISINHLITAVNKLTLFGLASWIAKSKWILMSYQEKRSSLFHWYQHWIFWCIWYWCWCYIHIVSLIGILSKIFNFYINNTWPSLMIGGVIVKSGEKYRFDPHYNPIVARTFTFYLLQLLLLC